MRQWLEQEHILPIIAASVGTPPAFPVMLALHSLRRSELLAATWDDIYLDAGTMRKIYTHLSQRDTAKAQNKMRSFYENACSLACNQKAARISPGGSLYFSHDFLSMSISATIPGCCFFSSANLARAARRSFPGNVSVSVSTTVPSS